MASRVQKAGESISEPWSTKNDYTKKKRRNVFRKREVPVKFFVWDTETTGLDSSEKFIIEIAIKSHIPNNPRDAKEFSTLVRPEQEFISTASERLNVNPGTLNGAPSFPEAWKLFVEFVEKVSGKSQPVLIAHMSSYDQWFLCEELRRNDLALPKSWLYACSVAVFRELMPDRSVALASLVEYLGVTNYQPHRAMSDVNALCHVLHQTEHQHPIFVGTVKKDVYDELIANAKYHILEHDIPLPADKCWVTANGKRYHLKSTCYGLQKAHKSSISTVAINELSDELQPCKICSNSTLKHSPAAVHTFGMVTRSRAATSAFANRSWKAATSVLSRSKNTASSVRAKSHLTSTLFAGKDKSSTSGDTGSNSSPNQNSNLPSSAGRALNNTPPSSIQRTKRNDTDKTDSPQAAGELCYVSPRGARYHRTETCEGLKHGKSIRQTNTASLSTERSPSGICWDKSASENRPASSESVIVSSSSKTAYSHHATESKTSRNAKLASSPGGERCYVSPSGMRYHRMDNCTGLRSARSIRCTTTGAISPGITPCRLCWNTPAGINPSIKNQTKSTPSSSTHSVRLDVSAKTPKMKAIGNSAEKCFVTATGMKYHREENCYGLRNARAIINSTVNEASLRLTPCRLCC